MSWRVLVSAPYILPVIEEFRPWLESEGIEIVIVPVRERLGEAELLPIIETIDGAICGDDQFTRKVLSNAPLLKVISKWGTGIDSIDLDAAAELGIRVCNTPNAFTDAVADTTLGYMLCFARFLPRMDREIRQGLWQKPNAISLAECTLGVIGVGNIGKAVIRRAKAFGIRICANETTEISRAFVEETGLIPLPLDELLKKSDFVTLHCDLNPTSFHLIGQPELSLMKPSAYLINTSRGPVIDEAALIQALQTQQIAGAALDVFEVEPLPADSPLRIMDNCMFAPHNANSSFAAKKRVHQSTIENLLKGLRAL
jgi:D-3-phosphoglycerate dehydrogenase / 2-oxoglutarate reductase